MIDERWQQLADLRERIDITSQALESSLAAVTRLSYRDPTGAILVRLDADGSVEDIAICDDWKQRGLDPESLGGAVLAAVESAGLQRLNDLGPGDGGGECAPGPAASAGGRRRRRKAAGHSHDPCRRVGGLSPHRRPRRCDAATRPAGLRRTPGTAIGRETVAAVQEAARNAASARLAAERVATP